MIKTVHSSNLNHESYLTNVTKSVRNLEEDFSTFCVELMKERIYYQALFCKLYFTGAVD